LKGLDFFLAVVANLLINVKSEGKEVKEHLMGCFLRKLE
jgi:hypothetical protein